MLLVIIDMFEEQDNIDLRELCVKNSYKIVIILHNLNNKFPPLDLSVNKAAKWYFSDKYKTWMVNEVLKQLKKA